MWTHPDGSSYHGQFTANVRQGKGVEHTADGDTYDGQWEGGIKNGTAVWTNAAGGRYEGQYKNGLKHGNGDFVCGGYSYRGTWFNGDPTIPPGTFQLKTARDDTDDFEAHDVEFMNPVPADTLTVTMEPPEEGEDEVDVPLHHLVFYVKKPAFENPYLEEPAPERSPSPAPSVTGSEAPAGSRPETAATQATDAEAAADEEDEEEEAPVDTRIRRSGIEAGRALSVALHRREDPAEKGGELTVLSPRPLLQPVDRSSLKPSPRTKVESVLVESDEQGFIMCKGLRAPREDVGPGKYVLVCTDASPDGVTSVVHVADPMHIPLDITEGY